MGECMLIASQDNASDEYRPFNSQEMLATYNATNGGIDNTTVHGVFRFDLLHQLKMSHKKKVEQEKYWGKLYN